MKIAIYTHCAALFHRMCEGWVRHLARAGHRATLVATEWQWEEPFPVDSACDVHLFVACTPTLKALDKHGTPSRGTSVVWLLEPLTDRRDAPIQAPKAGLLGRVIERFDAAIGMDSEIVSYVEAIAPGLPTAVIPYTVDELRILQPLADEKRKIDVIHVGTCSERRAGLAKQFGGKAFKTRFVWGGLWEKDRDIALAFSRISLQMHIDEHRYFDQHRIFESWAAGCAVVAEESGPPRLGGVETGKHMAVASSEELADTCERLLADSRRRLAMIAASQDLLRERYTPAAWVSTMVELLQRVR